MIFQGLFNILDLYFKDIDLFYNAIEKYFGEKINTFFENESPKSKDLKEEFK